MWDLNKKGQQVQHCACSLLEICGLLVLHIHSTIVPYIMQEWKCSHPVFLPCAGRLASKPNFKAVFQRDKLLWGLRVCIVSMLALASSNLIRAPRAVICAITTWGLDRSQQRAVSFYCMSDTHRKKSNFPAVLLLKSHKATDVLVYSSNVRRPPPVCYDPPWQHQGQIATGRFFWCGQQRRPVLLSALLDRPKGASGLKTAQIPS